MVIAPARSSQARPAGAPPNAGTTPAEKPRNPRARRTSHNPSRDLEAVSGNPDPVLANRTRQVQRREPSGIPSDHLPQDTRRRIGNGWMAKIQQEGARFVRKNEPPLA